MMLNGRNDSILDWMGIPATSKRSRVTAMELLVLLVVVSFQKWYRCGVEHIPLIKEAEMISLYWLSYTLRLMLYSVFLLLQW